MSLTSDFFYNLFYYVFLIDKKVNHMCAIESTCNLLKLLGLFVFFSCFVMFVCLFFELVKRCFHSFCNQTKIKIKELE